MRKFIGVPGKAIIVCATHDIIQHRAKDPDDELQFIIVQNMLLTGFDSPPLHTMHMDRPMRGAALMQALARVNRTFRNKQDGLLVGYAPLADKLAEAIAEYTVDDQATKPLGRELDDAIDEVASIIRVIDEEILGGYDWRAVRAQNKPRAYLDAVVGAASAPQTPLATGWRRASRRSPSGSAVR